MSAPARDQFDRQAVHYNERWASWSNETLQRMLETADVLPGAHARTWRVLDVATGGGWTALAFAPHVREVVATDISTAMLAQAQNRAQAAGVTNIVWQEAAAEALPFADASFDLVTVRIAPHHFTNVPAFLREARRVLAPSGALILGDTTVPDDDPEAAAWQNAIERVRDPSHVANVSPNQWRSLLQAAEFVVAFLDHTSGRIPMFLSAWLHTAGCTGDAARQVRRMFANAPVAARKEFAITIDAEQETHFAWQRVVLRAEQG